MGPSAEQWWQSAVAYQVYPRSFADSDGDGVGDLGGVLQHVDHFERLGVDVVWLSPVYRSPQVDNGYDVSDYCDVDPVFGSLEQLDRLIEELHARGIKLLMDLVVNHTSDEHPWFVESASSRTSPKRDWYIWRDPRDDAEPNNWGSFFSGSAWQWHEGSGQYYLHLFHAKQPDLNWENSEVRAAVHAMMRWWLDRGVDGFRMDVVNFLSKTDGLPDAPTVPGQRYASPLPMVADGPRIHQHLAEMRREVFGGREGQFLVVGEMPGVTPDEAVRYTDPGRGEVDMVFQFEHVVVDQADHDKFVYLELDRLRLKRSLHRWQRALADRGWNSLYWNNHDQPRVVSRFGDDHPDHWRASATALATILHGLRGTPFVYQGEEIGMTNYPFGGPGDHLDTEAVRYLAGVVASGGDQEAALLGVAHVSRDNARSPMQWDASRHAGFTTGTPWFPVNPDHRWLNVAAQIDDAGSVLAHYRSLIRLRHEHRVLAVGGFTALWEDDPDLWCYVRDGDAQQLLVVANCSRGARALDLPDWAGATLLLGNQPGTDPVLGPGPCRLTAWDARMYLR